jgi:hypothetical protein
MSDRLPRVRVRWALVNALAPIAGLVTLTSCSPAPPFNSYDPPPAFAIHYSAGDLRAYSQYAGSQLRGTLLGDINNHPAFVATGAASSFNQFFTFGKYGVVQGGRWPALWVIESIRQCGEGTFMNIEITQKIIYLGCNPTLVPINVSPGGFPRNTAPAAVTVSVGGVAGGTAAYAYVIDPGQNNVVASQGVTVDSSGSFQLSLPSSFSDGYYTVVAEFDGLGYAAQGGFNVWTEGGGGGDPCDSPSTHDHSGSCGGADSCGHVFGSDSDCGCPNAPIVYDTCYQTVCDTNSYWVDEWCGGWVCQWDTYCYYNEWGEYVCEPYPYDCYWEPNYWVCGGHWETEQTNCREEPYECNPHQCGF